MFKSTSTFVALEVARQLVRSLAPLIPRIARHDASLADQLRGAGSSVLLNVAEGNRRVGRDRAHFFRIAAGSCGEADGILEVAEAWCYVTVDETEASRGLADRELGLLWGLTHRR